jgi:tetratricopeptide (TPR) repeat protein
MIATLLLLTLSSAHADAIDRLVLQRRLTEAAAASDAELVRDPSDLDEHERWIDLQVTLGRSDLAVARYRRGLTARPDDPDLHYLLGRASPDLDSTRRSYEAALRINPDHARSWMGMGAVHRATGDIGAAAAAYQRALQLDLRLGEAWNGLLSTALAGGRTEAALDVARAATSAVPRDAEPWLALALLEPERAREHLIKAVELLPEEPRLLVALAEHHLAAGRAADALALSDRAAGLDPWSDAARALRLYAKAVSDGTLSVDGWRALESLRKANPADPAQRAAAERAATAWPRAAATWLVHARFSQSGAVGAEAAAAAQADLRRALDLDPGNDEAQAALGQLLLRQGDPRQAAPLLRAAADTRPHDASLAVAASRATFDAGDGAGALARVTAAARRFPDDPVVPIARADLLARSGDAAGAYEVLAVAWSRLTDLRIRIAMAAAAKAAGRREEAATIYEELARSTGDQGYLKAADAARRGN